jgi:hypothetical protein
MTETLGLGAKGRHHEMGYYQPGGASPTRPKPVSKPVANSAREAVRRTVKHRRSKYAGRVIES